MQYKIQIIGNLDDGFTSAEILETGGELAARVFELEAGWYVETEVLEKLRDQVLLEALLQARNKLLHYVNRKGGMKPEGLTRAGASLWLMQRDDGKGLTLPPAGKESEAAV